MRALQCMTGFRQKRVFLWLEPLEDRTVPSHTLLDFHFPSGWIDNLHQHANSLLQSIEQRLDEGLQRAAAAESSGCYHNLGMLVRGWIHAFESSDFLHGWRWASCLHQHPHPGHGQDSGDAGTGDSSGSDGHGQGNSAGTAPPASSGGGLGSAGNGGNAASGGTTLPSNPVILPPAGSTGPGGGSATTTPPANSGSSSTSPISHTEDNSSSTASSPGTADGGQIRTLPPAGNGTSAAPNTSGTPTVVLNAANPAATAPAAADPAGAEGTPVFGTTALPPVMQTAESNGNVARSAAVVPNIVNPGLPRTPALLGWLPLTAGLNAMLPLTIPGVDVLAQLAPLGADMLADMPPSPLLEAQWLTDTLADITAFISQDEVQAWLPWVSGAVLAAVAVEMARRQLKRPNQEVLPYPECYAAGWLPESIA